MHLDPKGLKRSQLHDCNHTITGVLLDWLIASKNQFSPTWTSDDGFMVDIFKGLPTHCLLKTHFPSAFMSLLWVLPPILQAHIKSSAPAAQLSVTETSVFLSFFIFRLSLFVFPGGWPFLLSLIQKRGAVTSDMHTQSNLSISGSITELASWAGESRNRIGARTIKSYFSSFSPSHYCFPSGPPPPSSDLHCTLLSFVLSHCLMITK